MPVPTYSPILDSELQAGDDALSTIFVRLRDNPLAVFGVDTTDPAPTVDPPRQFVYDKHGVDSPYINNASVDTTVTGAWVDLCDESLVGHRCSLEAAIAIQIKRNAAPSEVQSFLFVSGTPATGSPPAGDYIQHRLQFTPVFAAGVFSGVDAFWDNGFTPTQFGDPGGVYTGALVGGSCLAPASTTTLLLKATSGTYSTVWSQMSLEHRKVGTVHQIRIINQVNVSNSYSGTAQANVYYFNAYTELKG